MEKLQTVKVQIPHNFLSCCFLTILDIIWFDIESLRTIILFHFAISLSVYNTTTTTTTGNYILIIDSLHIFNTDKSFYKSELPVLSVKSYTSTYKTVPM